jgi:hypothetical protein
MRLITLLLFFFFPVNSFLFVAREMQRNHEHFLEKQGNYTVVSPDISFHGMKGKKLYEGIAKLVRNVHNLVHINQWKTFHLETHNKDSFSIHWQYESKSKISFPYQLITVEGTSVFQMQSQKINTHQIKDVVCTIKKNECDENFDCPFPMMCCDGFLHKYCCHHDGYLHPKFYRPILLESSSQTSTTS